MAASALSAASPIPHHSLVKTGAALQHLMAAGHRQRDLSGTDIHHKARPGLDEILEMLDRTALHQGLGVVGPGHAVSCRAERQHPIALVGPDEDHLIPVPDLLGG